MLLLDVGIYEISNYADYHDVDEDTRTIMTQCGDWPASIWAGIIRQAMVNAPTEAWNNVASSNIQISKYTDHHDVDEELKTFVRQGGQWPEGSLEGITYRYIFNSSSYAADDVALMKNKTSSPSTDC